MICFLISVILMISSYFLMISFIYSVLTNIIIDFHGNYVIRQTLSLISMEIML